MQLRKENTQTVKPGTNIHLPLECVGILHFRNKVYSTFINRIYVLLLDVTKDEDTWESVLFAFVNIRNNLFHKYVYLLFNYCKFLFIDYLHLNK